MNNKKNVSPQGEVNQSEVQVSNAELASVSMDMGSQNNAHADLNDAPIPEDQVENPTTSNDKQPDVAAQDSETLTIIRADMEAQGAIKQECYTCKLTDLIAMGYIIATFVMNREVNDKHVKRLMKDVRAQGKKAFSQHVTVCSALSALLLGYDVIGIDGKPVTLEMDNLAKVLAIIDGQHRVAACLGTELDIDCDVMIAPCPKDIAQDIKDRNCCDKNWDTSALRHQIVEVEKKQDVLAEYEKRAKEIYPGCSDKFYTTMLNAGKKDAVRRAQVARGELPDCDIKKAEMGLEILRAFRLLNPDCNKNPSMTLKMVELIMKKMDELAVADMTNGEFVEAFKVFASLNEKACDTKEGAEDFIANFSESFSRFIDQHQEVDEVSIVAVNEHMDKIIAAGPAKEIKPQTGSLHEMIQRIKTSEDESSLKAAAAAEKAAKKSQKDATKAAKKKDEQKVKEAGKMVEDLTMKSGCEIKDNSNT